MQHFVIKGRSKWNVLVFVRETDSIYNYEGKDECLLMNPKSQLLCQCGCSLWLGFEDTKRTISLDIQDSNYPFSNDKMISLNLPSLFNIYRQYAFFVSLLPPWQPTQPTYPTPSLIDTQLTTNWNTCLLHFSGSTKLFCFTLVCPYGWNTP